MTGNGHESTNTTARTGPGSRPRAHRTVRVRGGRRLLAPLAGIAAAAALIAGCGGAGTEEPAGGPAGETTEASETDEGDETDGDATEGADEGVEHLWLITVGPADAGLEIEVENAS